MSTNQDSLDRYLKGRVLIGKRVLQPHRGSIYLEWAEDFYLSDTTLEELSEKLLVQMKDYLIAKGLISS